MPANIVASQEAFNLPVKGGMTTMNRYWGSGFYADDWGPLPYSYGRALFERYTVLRLQVPQVARAQ
jgi:hypothetical protein